VKDQAEEGIWCLQSRQQHCWISGKSIEGGSKLQWVASTQVSSQYWYKEDDN